MLYVKLKNYNIIIDASILQLKRIFGMNNAFHQLRYRKEKYSKSINKSEFLWKV